MPTTPTSRGSRTGLRWLACAVVLATAATVLAIGSRRADASADSRRTSADRLEIAQWRARLHHTLIDEVDAMVLAVVGDSTDDVDLDTVRSARVATHEAATTALAAIAESDSGAAAEAMELCDLLTTDGLGDRPAPAARLTDIAWAVVSVGLPGPHDIAPEESELLELIGLGVPGAVVLNDALDAAVATEHPEPTPLLADYLRHSERSIHENAGYLGPDSDHPLLDSPLHRGSTTDDGSVVAQIDAAVAATDLWAYDAWNRSWRGRPRPSEDPPLTLAELADQATSVDAAASALVDDALETARGQARADADAAARRSLIELIAAIVLAVGGIAGGAVLAARFARRIRATAALASTDRLTGVGNRHALHTETSALLADPAYPHHLVAMIDLDRFKLVNDSWGHAVGDQVLCEIAEALGAVVAQHVRAGSGAGTVIRLGGDEFLLTLHSRRPIERAALVQRLDEVRTRAVEPRPGERLALSFSIGVVVVDGPADVDDVLRTADLAAYDDKARRATLLGERRTPLPPPPPMSFPTPEPTALPSTEPLKS
jgi:diguanylate cyclase (GGDEF)-like protein